MSTVRGIIETHQGFIEAQTELGRGTTFRVYLPADNRLDFGRFLTADLSQVQVAKGYVSVLNGPGALGGAADYWLGVCEALVGRPDAAVRAFARVPEGYPFDPVGAYHEAKSNLSRTLKSMERFGFVELLKGEGGAVRPRVPYEEIKLNLPIGQRHAAASATPVLV